MTSEPLTIDVPMKDMLECPMCRSVIKVMGQVEVSPGEIRRTGTTGLKPNYAATLSTNIKTITIEHKCEVNDGYYDEY